MKAILLACVGLGWASAAVAQPGGNPFSARAAAALAEPFVGLTTDGTPETGLFSIEATGIDTGAVRRAAEALIAALSDEQRTRLSFSIDDSEWRNWANIHRFVRQGVSLDEMTAAQREAAYALLQTAFSARGYRTSRDIMRLNHHLAELTNAFDEYGEHLYWFTVMGTPSAVEPWGFQLDGHHLVVNYMIVGDRLVMTPTFMGSEPVRAEAGRYAGTEVLDLERDRGLEFMRSLSDAQRARALVSTQKSRTNARAEMFSDNVRVPLEGLPASALDAAQRDKLLAVVATYVGNMPHEHAEQKMLEIRAHLDRTYFSWRGSFGADSAFYYRVQSPVIYIEFDHQGPVALDGARDVATRRHVHTVVRTPNGNDYGKDLLRQHYEAHRNDPSHGHTAERL